MGERVPAAVSRAIVEFAGKAGVRRVILFGSRARGTNHARSDVDLAVSGGDFDAFYWDVMERMPPLLSFDVVHLEEAGEALREEIRRDGVVLYEKA